MAGKFILFVEDDEGVRAVYLLMRRYLPNYYVIHIAASGEMALKLIFESRFDVVVTDMNMAGMSGRQLFLATKDKYLVDPENFKMPKFVFCSGMEAALANITVESSDEFKYATMVKPFDLRDLADTIVSFEK